MYNSYVKESQAWWAMREAEEVLKELDSTRDSIENCFETIIDDFDTACSERDDFEEELEQERKEHEETKDKLEAAGKPFAARYAVALRRTAAILLQTAQELEDEYEIENPFIPPADSSDGGSQDSDSESPGEASSEGVTRPQVP